MFADASELIVTTNSIVRTNWSSMRDYVEPTSTFNNNNNTNSNSNRRNGPTPSHINTNGNGFFSSSSSSSSSAANNIRSTPGRRNSHQQSHGILDRNNDSSLTNSSIDPITTDLADDLDIEVKIAGNFIREEMFNAGVHGIGLLLSIIGAFPLLAHAQTIGDNNMILGYILYLIGLIFLFGTSTLNHSLHMLDSSAFTILNHSAVYVLIAGTYSPFLLVNLRHVTLGIALLIAVWICAIIGVTISTLCPTAHIPSNSSSTSSASTSNLSNPLSSNNDHVSNESNNTRTTCYRNGHQLYKRIRPFLYGGMGWLALIPFYLLYPCIEPQGWLLLGIGGVAFTLGVVLYIRERRHADASSRIIYAGWYILVVLACATHYFAVYNYVAIPNEQCIAQAIHKELAFAPYWEKYYKIHNYTQFENNSSKSKQTYSIINQLHSDKFSHTTSDNIEHIIHNIDPHGIITNIDNNIDTSLSSLSSSSSSSVTSNSAINEEKIPLLSDSSKSSSSTTATTLPKFSNPATIRDAASILLSTLANASALAAADGREAVLNSLTTVVSEMRTQLEAIAIVQAALPLAQGLINTSPSPNNNNNKGIEYIHDESSRTETNTNLI